MFLGLLWSGSVHADKKIEKALERCADTQITYGNTNEICRHKGLKSPRFQQE